ncbi:MAG: methyltetrahydrofolate--corrinoid methyltransferase [Desulfobacterales bacterium RIFOXYA12_FULL_46_15]|nr:MAG: methyltetrahydrofolate--corrinoid methyltransferase [Desulfobacterales bacterium RIFOXYA12_FULL_46_15]
MIIIGELINASRKAVATAIESCDKEAIRKIAMDQAEHHTDYIDVNAGIFVDKEAEYLTWLVETVQDATDIPCAIDSPDPKAVEAALKVHKGTAMINSISLEKERYDNIMPIIAGTGLKVVALCMSDEGMPVTVDDRLKIAGKLINGLLKNNILVENIFVDPLVQPLAVDKTYGMGFINTIEAIKKEFKGIHTACGLSNISYGLPGRKHLNRAFMIQAVLKGLDGAIINPLDKGMMSAIITAEALAGKDDYCMNYLKAFRSGLFN